ncbi:MAG TPA: GNAT family N-acetyltransferase [Gammaproteobacteria bacterium]|nr:GNAT family N-acetyltransferase [Gammaproteobacteria bacterium]
MLDNYIVERSTEGQFSSMKDEWTHLLDRYDNATLFNTWEWQYAWWHTWAKELDGELYLILVRNKSGELVGLAPLYRYKYSVTKGLFKYNKIQLIGSSATMRETVRSEYLDFIYDSNSPEIVGLLLSHIFADGGWSKALFPDIRTNSILFAHLTNKALMKDLYVRATLKDVGVAVDTSGSFELYKKKLGKNIRLSCFNRRKRLEKSGEVSVVSERGSSKENSVNILNEFHLKRWGRPCFDEQAILFLKNLVSIETPVIIVKFSEILLDGKNVSIIYNIDYKGVRYNIQLGFAELEDKKVSMGNIQLGYAIEEAFDTQGINYFDFLAGYGKNSFYKKRFNGESYRLYTLEVIRSPILRFIYKVYDIYRYLT